MQYQPLGMKCPRCVQGIHRAALACPHCGFSLADADVLFGEGEVKLRRLTDAAGLFRRKERDRIEEALDEFGRKFPQLFAAVYTGSLGGTGNIRQYGFWLLNRGLFEDVDPSKPNEGGVLFVIDPDTKSAGMSFGYGLDAFFEEKDSFECLSSAHSQWLEGRYADGFLTSLRALAALLRRRARLVKRDPEKYERRVATPLAVGDLVKKIRTGNVKRPLDEVEVESEEVER